MTIGNSYAAIAEYGTGSAGSRLLTGTTPLHLEMEQALAGFIREGMTND